jgi:hypothetical protein
MDENLSHQILDELLPSLESLDTKVSALLQLLKDKGIATQEELTKYLDQAANASNVRWLAARVRLDYLLSSAAKAPDPAAEKKSPQPADHREPVSEPSAEGKHNEKTNAETSGPKETTVTDDRKNTDAGTKKTSPEPIAENKKDKEKTETGDPATAVA